MKTPKKSFGQIWSELTSEQAEYLKDYINKQRQDSFLEHLNRTARTFTVKIKIEKTKIT